MKNSAYQPYRAVLLASIGSGLEYYCFITYALLTPFLSELFFVKENPHLALLNAMIIFAIGYLTAPIGALFFGRYADAHGRKPTFIISLSLMAVVTFLMGCLPSFAHIGYLAVVALVILRLLQGIATGAEIPGGITFIVEHTRDKNRAFLCGLMFFSVAIGAMLSTLVNFLLNHFLNHAQMLQFGWRIAFYLGGLLGIIGILIRRNAKETPLFLTHAKAHQTICWQEIMQLTFIKKFIVGFGVMLLPASMVTFGLFLPAFYQSYYQIAPADGNLAMTTGFFVSAFALPVFGIIADKIGHKNWYMIAAIITLFLFTPTFLALNLSGKAGLFLNAIIFYFLIVGMAGVYPSLLAELFPTTTRYTGVGLTYMLCYSVVGFVPLLINYLTLQTQYHLALLAYFIPIALISIFAASRLKTALK